MLIVPVFPLRASSLSGRWAVGFRNIMTHGWYQPTTHETMFLTLCLREWYVLWSVTVKYISHSECQNRCSAYTDHCRPSLGSWKTCRMFRRSCGDSQPRMSAEPTREDAGGRASVFTAHLLRIYWSKCAGSWLTSTRSFSGARTVHQTALGGR